jgi:hypothetical protein
LEGEAVQVIKSLEFTASAYDSTWDHLCNNHINALFNMESIQLECSVKIRNLMDTVAEHLRALKSLNQPTDTWDTLIIHIVKTKLDAVTVREWEEYKVNNEIPNLKQFLKGRADLLESVEANKSPSGNHKHNSKPKTRSSNPRSLLSVERHDSTYTVCKNNHQVYNCEVFLGLSAPQRVEKIRSLKACLNCLKSGHMASNCKSGSCRKCGKNTIRCCICSQTVIVKLNKQPTSKIRQFAGQHNSIEQSHYLKYRMFQKISS